MPDDADAPLRFLEKRVDQPMRPGATADDQDLAEVFASPERPVEVPDGAKADPHEGQKIHGGECHHDRAAHVLDLEEEQDGEQECETDRYPAGRGPGVLEQ